MKRSFIRTISLAVLFALLLPFAAVAEAAPKAASTKVTIGVKEKYQVVAKGLSGKLTYKTSDKKVATVTAKGVVTGKKEGKAKITVTSGNGGKLALTVTVAKAPASVTLNKSAASLKTGKTLQLKAKLPSKTASNKLTWTTSNAAVASVDKKGKVTAKSAGKATITVKTFNGKKATCKVTVSGGSSALTGDVSGILGKDLYDVDEQLPDKLRYFQYGAYTNDYFLVETDSDDSIISISLLTDAETGIGKYTLFGLYPGVSYGTANNTLSKSGWKQGSNDSSESYYYSPARPDVILYVTIIDGYIDLISYLYY